jgi:putative CocE/NonD family hydrolase
MAFVAQDTRGHNQSGGHLAPFDEANDGWDTLEWITSQPWSDGTTAVFGESYVGFSAIAAAGCGHPSVRAAALRNTGTDIGGDWIRHQGVLRLEFVLRWALAAWSGPENVAPEFNFAKRPLDQIARGLVPSLGANESPDVLDAWASGGRSAVGPRWPTLIDQLRVPVHLTTGWWDLFVRGAVRDWSRLSARPGVESRFVADVTDHAGRDWSDGPTVDPLADFTALADRMPEILNSEIAFLRRQLLGVDDGPAAVASWMLTHAGMRTSDSWPPPNVETVTLHLVDGGHAGRGPEGGGLSTRSDRIPIQSRWRHDPSNLVPALEGDTVEGWFRRPDERQTQVRPDVLTFTSDRERTPIDLAGAVTANLVIQAPPAGGHVMAKLCDVRPDGEAQKVAEGAMALVPAGDGLLASVDLGHTGYRIRPGHRLRLEVSSSAFPRYAPHPGTTEDPWTATACRPADLSLVTGSGGSTLSLSVLRR